MESIAKYLDVYYAERSDLKENKPWWTEIVGTDTLLVYFTNPKVSPSAIANLKYSYYLRCNCKDSKDIKVKTIENKNLHITIVPSENALTSSYGIQQILCYVDSPDIRKNFPNRKLITGICFRELFEEFLNRNGNLFNYDYGTGFFIKSTASSKNGFVTRIGKLDPKDFDQAIKIQMGEKLATVKRKSSKNFIPGKFYISSPTRCFLYIGKLSRILVCPEIDECSHKYTSCSWFRKNEINTLASRLVGYVSRSDTSNFKSIATTPGHLILEMSWANPDLFEFSSTVDIFMNWVRRNSVYINLKVFSALPPCAQLDLPKFELRGGSEDDFLRAIESVKDSDEYHPNIFSFHPDLIYNDSKVRLRVIKDNIDWMQRKGFLDPSPYLKKSPFNCTDEELNMFWENA